MVSPRQLVNVSRETTVIVAVVSIALVLTPVNDPILPIPEAERPIEGASLIQLYIILGLLLLPPDVKVILVVVSFAHIT